MIQKKTIRCCYQMNKQKALSMGIQAFVMKPFIIKDVAETIREVLEST